MSYHWLEELRESQKERGGASLYVLPATQNPSCWNPSKYTESLLLESILNERCLYLQRGL